MLQPPDPGGPRRPPPLIGTVKRRGRVTSGQQRAIDAYWPTLGCELPATGPLDPDALFGRVAPLVLDIGFGDGEALVAMAQADPGRNYLGVELHRPGIGIALAELAAHEVHNVRLALADARLLLAALGPQSLAQVQVYFPDPWPKVRHHKRRLLGPTVLAQIADRLAPAGRLHVATDWLPYADQVRALIQAEPGLTWDDPPQPTGRPPTRFSRRATAAGRPICELTATKALRT